MSRGGSWLEKCGKSAPDAWRTNEALIVGFFQIYLMNGVALKYAPVFCLLSSSGAGPGRLSLHLESSFSASTLVIFVLLMMDAPETLRTSSSWHLRWFKSGDFPKPTGALKELS